MQGSTDATPPPRHLVAVWNPSYTDDAMDAHLRVLLRWAEEAREARADRLGRWTVGGADDPLQVRGGARRCSDRGW
jgi:hypothetical protein